MYYGQLENSQFTDWVAKTLSTVLVYTKSCYHLGTSSWYLVPVLRLTPDYFCDFHQCCNVRNILIPFEGILMVLMSIMTSKHLQSGLEFPKLWGKIPTSVFNSSGRTIHWFTSNSSERETPNSRKLQNAFPVCCRNKQRNFTTNQASCFRNTRRKWRISGWKFFTGKALSFWLEFIDKTGKKVFCLQMQIKLKCCVTLFSWLVLINKLKTKFNNLFYRIIWNTNRIHNSFWRNFPARAKQTPSKVLFVAKKKRRPRPFGHRGG